jgi:hypothetical protein
VAKYIAAFDISRISFQKMEKELENSVISRDFSAIFQKKKKPNFPRSPPVAALL